MAKIHDNAAEYTKENSHLGNCIEFAYWCSEMMLWIVCQINELWVVIDDTPFGYSTGLALISKGCRALSSISWFWIWRMCCTTFSFKASMLGVEHVTLSTVWCDWEMVFLTSWQMDSMGISLSLTAQVCINLSMSVRVFRVHVVRTLFSHLSWEGQGICM